MERQHFSLPAGQGQPPYVQGCGNILVVNSFTVRTGLGMHLDYRGCMRRAALGALGARGRQGAVTGPWSVDAGDVSCGAEAGALG